jgi:parallel beta-helix repeat protein
MNHSLLGKMRMLRRTFFVLMLTLLLASMLTLAFNIQPVKASGTIYIRADGSIDPPDAPISTVDNVTYVLTGNITSDADGIVMERNNIIVDGNGYTIQGAGGGKGIDLSGRTNVTVKNAQITGFFYGVYLNSSSNNIVSGNKATANVYHISLQSSSNNNISGNCVINSGGPGVSSGWGIHVAFSSSNSICGNNAANNEWGINIGDSSNNTMTGNNMTNGWVGINIYHSSNNTITGNKIANNQIGIEFSNSSNNTIYHNNFIDNRGRQVYIYSYVSINVWDNGYPSGGNYWSDYTGTDANGDGIGDTPYVIDVNNQDRYPLTHPWSPLPVHNINTGLGYATIQEAINANETLDGHTIFVETGTYYENVVMNKTLSLIGENKDTTIIDGGNDFEAIALRIIVNNIVFRGFTTKVGGMLSVNMLLNETDNTLIADNNLMRGELEPSGIRVYSSANITLTRNNITGYGPGVVLFNSSCVSIAENRIVEGSAGVGLVKSFNNTVTRNNLTEICGSAILLSESFNNTIADNKITGWVHPTYGYSGAGIQLRAYPGENGSSNNTFYDNEIRNCSFGILVPYYVGGALHHNNIFLRNNVENNNYGAELWHSFNFTFKDNRFSDNKYGFGVYGFDLLDYIQDIDSSNTVDGKLVYYWVNQQNRRVPEDAGYVALINSTDITAKNLDLKNNGQGLLLAYTKNSLITSNNITNNNRGIHIDSSSNSSIIGNNITANNFDGIRIEYSSNNSISGNNITENKRCGVYFQDSSNNTIHHNNFINNTNQAYSYGSANVWDDGYPSGGNYWSDYTGVDVKSGSDQNETGSDGIGDTPYDIYTNNRDRYPLMGLFNMFDAGTWNGLAYNVDVVSNSTVSDFHFDPQEGPFLEFNVTGQEGTAVFCRVAIPKNLLWAQDGQWIVLVGDVPVTNYTTASDQNYTYLYFTYGHSIKTVQITGTNVIPELPSTTIATLLMILAMLATAFATRKIRKEASKLRVKPL